MTHLFLSKAMNHISLAKLFLLLVDTRSLFNFQMESTHLSYKSVLMFSGPSRVHFDDLYCACCIYVKLYSNCVPNNKSLYRIYLEIIEFFLSNLSGFFSQDKRRPTASRSNIRTYNSGTTIYEPMILIIKLGLG